MDTFAVIKYIVMRTVVTRFCFFRSFRHWFPLFLWHDVHCNINSRFCNYILWGKFNGECIWRFTHEYLQGWAPKNLRCIKASQLQVVHRLDQWQRNLKPTLTVENILRCSGTVRDLPLFLTKTLVNCVMAEVVNHQVVIVEAWFQSKANACVIFGG